jgi:putative alpha-1,2-mannosidase
LRADDDYALSVLASALNKSSDAGFFRYRARQNAFTMFNEDTGFMEARDSDGSWSGPDAGWTEGDKWCYSFGVMHDIPTLIDLRGGPYGFVRSLDEHFEGGEVFGLYLPLSFNVQHQ